MTRHYNIGDSRVLESRESTDGMSIRRRRESPDGQRFTTYERVERRSITVVKSNGKRESYDHDKLSNGIHRSVGKFFANEMEVEAIINTVEERVFALGKNEVQSKEIGEIVLDVLAENNEVAYVRFASVFYEFRTLDDFVKILEQTRSKKAR